MNADFDVVVIGASVAGASTATLLARSGLRVGLFDKSTFPRQKPCGEGLSRAGLNSLTRLGLWEGSRIPHHNFSGFSVTVGTRSVLLCSQRGGGVTVERSVLDHHIVKCAVGTKGVAGYFGNEVFTQVGTMHRTPRSLVEIASANGTCTSTALVIADGGNSPTCAAMGIQPCRRAGTIAGASVHFQGQFSRSINGVHIFVEDGFEIYAAPLAGGRLNLAALAPHPRHMKSPNLRNILEQPEIQRKVFTQMYFDGAKDGAICGRAQIGSTRESTDPRIFLVGDAAEEFDPIGGMGMTHAVLSAELVANALIASQAFGSVSPDSSIQRLAMAHTRYVRARYRHARFVRRFTSSAALLLRGARRFPPLLSLCCSPIGRLITDQVLPPDTTYATLPRKCDPFEEKRCRA